jgi:hypothetical protein
MSVPTYKVLGFAGSMAIELCGKSTGGLMFTQ